ncbi:DUF3106 domain-containing protein [Pseudoxanthomonas sp. UTMC 1351]|uniref:DUF3106 domain-containing protein n=1 Tax=Pseudoxanthomonas sp. UTMC 1351 TaxID=2695853 RepID=UPI0034CF1459
MRSSSGLLRFAIALSLVAAVFGLPALSSDAQDTLRQRRWRLDALSPPQRAAFVQRMTVWNALPREEREDRRARYAAWRELDELQRMRVHAAAVEIHALPVEQQAELRSRFDALDDMQRRGWRLGPVLGADYPRLQPLFGFVAEAERDATISLLRQLDAEQRDDLAVLAQRIPPQERAAFRQELLAVPAATRSTWLRSRRDR